jgi:hypothetical protein
MPIEQNKYIITEVTKIAIRVPKMENIMMVPKCLKKGLVSMLMALSNRIGGRRIIRKNWLKSSFSSSIISSAPILTMQIPEMSPTGKIMIYKPNVVVIMVWFTIRKTLGNLYFIC